MEIRNLFKGDKFLGLFSLDSGGVIIGALGLFCNLIQLLANGFFLFSLLFTGDFCPQKYLTEDTSVNVNIPHVSNQTQDRIKDTINYAQQGIVDVTRQAQGLYNNYTGNEISCSTLSKIPFGIVFLGMIILSLIGTIAHYRMIKAVEENKAKGLRLARGYYMFFVVLRTILLIALVIWCFFNGKMLWPAIATLICLLIDVYVLATIDNLRIKYEHTLPSNTAQTTRFVQKTTVTGPTSAY